MQACGALQNNTCVFARRRLEETEQGIKSSELDDMVRKALYSKKARHFY